MNIFDQLKRDEGLRLVPYTDTVGKITIGYGTNLSDGIDEDEAAYLLNRRAVNAAISLAKALPWTNQLDEARRGVLINMTYNMGIAGLLGFKNTLALVQAGDYDKAAEAMLQSKWADQVGARAHRLSVQMRSGEWQ